MLIDILTGATACWEVDVDMEHDVTGRNWHGFIHRGTQFADILKLLLKKLKERRISA